MAKGYDHLTNKPKDGDSANEQLRQIIDRDLNDIKSKLDSLSLKDLDASYSLTTLETLNEKRLCEGLFMSDEYTRENAQVVTDL